LEFAKYNVKSSCEYYKTKEFEKIPKNLSHFIERHYVQISNVPKNLGQVTFNDAILKI